MQNGDGNKILEQQRAGARRLVSLRGPASASDTFGTLGVFPSTVRRDLAVLEREGFRAVLATGLCLSSAL